jgi:hypothetical protein
MKLLRALFATALLLFAALPALAYPYSRLGRKQQPLHSRAH